MTRISEILNISPTQIGEMYFYEYTYLVQDLKEILKEKKEAAEKQQQEQKSQQKAANQKMPKYTMPKMPNYKNFKK